MFGVPVSSSGVSEGLVECMSIETLDAGEDADVRTAAITGPRLNLIDQRASDTHALHIGQHDKRRESCCAGLQVERVE